MRTFLVWALAFDICIALVGDAAAQTQTAVYDPATGSIVLDGLENVGAIQLRSGDNGGTDQLRVENVNDLGGFVAGTGTQQIDWLFFRSLYDGPFNVGAIAPAGVRQETLDANYFLGTLVNGSGGAEPRFNPIRITGGLIIPEPGTASLAWLCVLGFVAARSPMDSFSSEVRYDAK